MVRETSIETFNKIRDEGLLSEMRMKVYECIYLNAPITASEVFEKLNLKTNQSGRFTELKELGVIKEVGTRRCNVTGNHVYEWDVTNTLPADLKKKSFKDRKQEILDLIRKLPYGSDIAVIYRKVRAL